MSELNRTVVLAFYTAALVEKNAEAAVRLVSESYKQHNPNIEDGSSGLRKFITWYARQYPKSTATVNRSFVDGDFVILDAHVVRCPGELGSAVADIFRLETERSWSIGIASNQIAVGTPVSGRPPHRSERAQFTHSAPTSGV